MLGDTPVEEDLHDLTDSIGGRPTGSAANEASVKWALDRFREAGVDAYTEAFEMPAAWREVSAAATFRGADGDVSFSPRVDRPGLFRRHAGQAASTRRSSTWYTVRNDDFARLGDAAEGAFVLVSTDPLLDVPGLFAEYISFSEMQGRAAAAGVAGVVITSSRPANNLFRHLSAGGPGTELPLVVVERDGGERAARLLRSGTGFASTCAWPSNRVVRSPRTT